MWIVNWQRNVDGAQEAELRSAAVQCPDSWRRAHNEKNGMCRECLYSQTIMVGTPEAFVHAERLESSVEIAVCC